VVDRLSQVLVTWHGRAGSVASAYRRCGTAPMFEQHQKDKHETTLQELVKVAQLIVVWIWRPLLLCRRLDSRVKSIIAVDFIAHY
jgi:hypothetical protein